MRCLVPSCSGNYQDKEISHSTQVKDELFVVDNVPAKVCDTCGDTVINPKTNEVLQKIIEEETS